MKANRISPFIYAIIACGIAACSGESVPTGPMDSHNRLTVSYADDPNAYEPPVSSGEGETGNPSGDDGSAIPSRPRALDEFIRSQGTFCADDGFGGCQQFAGPVANYLAWYDESQRVSVAVDYAGIASNWIMGHSGRSFGTDINGSVTEQPLGNGLSRFTVSLHGSNVMSYAAQGTNLNGSVMFGATPEMVARGGASPALGDVSMDIVYIAHEGAPMPDLMQLIMSPEAGQRVEAFRIKYLGDGQRFNGGSGGAVTPAPGASTYSRMHFAFSGDVMRNNPYDPRQTGATGFASITLQ